MVVDLDDEHRGCSIRSKPRRTEELEFNLEDAFIEYTSGPRRGLPIFSTEEEVAHV